MTDFKPIEYSAEYIKKYWEGPTNMFARYFTYFQRFLLLLSDAKYLLALLGLGVIKSDFTIPTWLLLLGGLATIIGGTIIGRWHLFKVQKATEFITTHHGSVTGYNAYNIQIEILKTLKEILKKHDLNRTKAVSRGKAINRAKKH